MEITVWETIAFQILYILPFIWIFFVKEKRSLKDFYFIVHNEKDIFWGFGVGSIFAGLSVVNVLVNKETILSNGYIYIGKGLPFFYIALLFVGIIGPLIEEIIFRGMLIPSLAERMKTPYALFFSVILFALIHGSFFLAMNTIVIGFILGLLLVKRKTIIPCFIVHLMVNTTFYITIQLVLLGKI